MAMQHPDEGFTLIEVLLVIVILGLLASVVVASMYGITAEAEETSCDAERRVLATAAEMYFAQRTIDIIPAADATPNGFELTLVNEGMLRETSGAFDLDTEGALVAVPGSACSL